MSVQPIEQVQNPFLDQPIPEINQPPAEVPQEDRHLLGISIGIAAAYLAWRMFIKDKVRKQTPSTPEEAQGLLAKAWEKYHTVWMTLAAKPIIQAYSVVPYPEAEKLAVAYATELGTYIHQTSSDALMEGFTAQINSGWGNGVAWHRATEGYGLDTRQMKNYISGLMTAEKKYGAEVIPRSAQKALDHAVLVRADRLGQAESFKAVQVGKNMIWMAMQASGDLPDGTMKKWITADDERVCPVCGPLDQVTVPLHRRFKSGDQRFYAPTVHPNCRCRIEIVYPRDLGTDVVKAVSGDEYDRDRKGRFAVNEERSALSEKKIALPKRAEKTLSLPARREKGLNLPQYAKISLPQYADIKLPKREAESLAEELKEVSEELEEAAEERRYPGWNYDAEVLVPASQVFKKGTAGFNDYGDFYRIFSEADSYGKIVKLSGQTGYYIPDDAPPWNSIEQTPAFALAYKNDVEVGLADVTAFNQQNDKESGGRADRRFVLANEQGKDAEIARIMLSGLNKKQLLYIIEATIGGAKDSKVTRSFINPDPTDENMSTSDIINFWESQDVNDVASAIFFAMKEEDEASVGSLNRDWRAALIGLKEAHNKGLHYKMRQYRGAGQSDYRTGTPVIFRIANGWHGETVGSKHNGVAKVNDNYRVINSVITPKPKGITGVPGHEYAQFVLIVDLAPYYETDIDRSDLIKTS